MQVELANNKNTKPELRVYEDREVLKMNSETELYKAIDKILWEDWDPIGVNDIQDARSEYYGYIPEIFSLVLKNASVEEIVGKLNFFSAERIGLTSNMNKSIDVANKIIAEGKKFLK